MDTISLVAALIIFLLLLIFPFVRKWWLKQKQFNILTDKFEKPPGYSYYPVIGHAHHFTNLEDIITISTSFKSRYGIAYLGPKVFFFLNAPDLFEECLTSDKCINKPSYFDIMKHAEGGLFLAKDNIWKAQRKLLNPGFKQNILNFYAGKFMKHDERFLRQLDEKVGQTFDINELAAKISFQKYFECAFGLDFDTKSEEYMQALEISVSWAQSKFISWHTSIPLINTLLGKDKVFESFQSTLTRITKEIVEERLKIIDQKSNNNHFQDDEECELIFIDHILHCIKQEKYDEKNLVAELITFIFAAIDTCSQTFSYLCLCLAMYPDIQEKVYEEIVQVTGDRNFHYSDYPRLTYLQMAIKETLRMFPVGPVIHRQTSDDVKIGEHIFPKDSILHVNIINVHRSSKYYTNPLTFDPERFAPDSEAVKNRHRFAFIPFSGGRRNCIGERFGMLSLVSSAVTIFKKFRFETTYNRVEDIRLQQKFTLVAVDGYPVKIHPRF